MEAQQRHNEAWAEAMRDATGLAWEAAWTTQGQVLRSDPLGEHERGLGFEAKVERWYAGPRCDARWSGGGYATARVAQEGQPAERGWRTTATSLLAPQVVRGAAAWAGHVAALLEAGSPAGALEALLGRCCRYDRTRCPPGWEVEPFDPIGTEEVEGPLPSPGEWTVASRGDRTWRYSEPPEGLGWSATARVVTARGDVVHPWTCPPDLARRLLWDRHERLVDPPWYAFDPAGLDRGRRLWSWRWAGRDHAASACPMSRADARALAWADFWAHDRAGATRENNS